MRIKSIKQIKDLAGKVVLLRADFNVPLCKGKVKEDFKLIMNLPTIRYLSNNKAKVVLISHLGRPEFTKSGQVSKKKQSSLESVARRLSILLRKKVKFVNQIIGDKVNREIERLKQGEILLLENLRFDPGEIKNSVKFAKKLSSMADIYVNNAFAVCHRKHASVSAIKKYLPAYAGLLLEEEIKSLNKIKEPKKPLVIIIGGAKMDTKIGMIKKMSFKATNILLGGAVANNFLAAKKLEIGKSLSDKASIREAKKLMNKKIILPVDVVVAKPNKFKPVKVKPVNYVNKGEMILDIGPQTMRNYAKYIKEAKTIIWNGPMGMFEIKPFHHGSLFIGRVVASRSKGKAFGLVGGGETVQVLRMTKMFDNIDWVSTGGGAVLAYLSNNKMPGLKKIIK